MVNLQSQNGAFSFDFGVNIPIADRHHIPLLYEAMQQNEFNGGHFTLRPMFSDLTLTQTKQPAGTLQWKSHHPVAIGEFCVSQVKVYPTYVHWMKAISPPAITFVPNNVLRLKQRLTQCNMLAGSMAALSNYDVEQLRFVRVEVTVLSYGIVDLFSNVNLLRPFVYELCQHVAIHQVTVPDVSRHIRDWLHRAIAIGLNTGNNNTMHLLQR